jgi:hypothetical protein
VAEQEPWRVAEDVLRWIDRYIDKSDIPSREAELFRPNEDGYWDFEPLEYTISVEFYPSSARDEDFDKLDVSLGIELNGKKAGCVLAQELEVEDVASLLRAADFGKSLFQVVKWFLQTKLQLSTPPHQSPQAKNYAEEKAKEFERSIKQQLEVKRPVRVSRSTAEDRRALIEKYNTCVEAIKAGKALPSSISKQLNKRGHQDPWKIALRWAANELGLKYKPSYLEKIFSRAKRENRNLSA